MATQAKSVTSTGTVNAGPGRVHGVQFRAGAAAGSVILKDGGGSGTTKLTIYAPASAAFAGFVPIGGGGIPFNTDIHATLSQVDGITVIFD